MTTIDTIDGQLAVSEVWWQQIDERDGEITGLIAADCPEGPLLTEEDAGRALMGDDYEHYGGECTWRPRRHDLAIAEMQEQRRQQRAERIDELADVIRRVQANPLVTAEAFPEHLATVIVAGGIEVET